MKKILFAAALAGAAILTACGDKGGGVRMGSLSEFDSLSYVLGANIGNGINFEMRDIPFDFKAIDKGIKESAMGKATQEHDKSLEMLREYFMTKRGERAQAIAAKRAGQHPSGRRRQHEGRISHGRPCHVRERGGARRDFVCFR